MKKDYKKPLVKVVNIQLQAVICNSIEVDSTAEAATKSNEVFSLDYDFEEEAEE